MSAGVDTLRAVELGVPDLEKSARFYDEVWGLSVVDRSAESCYFRATGPEWYVLALHRRDAPELVRTTLGARDRAAVDALHERVERAGGRALSEPGTVAAPGGGYGFSFRDLDDREF